MYLPKSIKEAQLLLSKDEFLKIKPFSATEKPQQRVWQAMHQDHSCEFVWNRQLTAPREAKAGRAIVKHLLGASPHMGPFEHPSIILNVGFFPHSVMQQLRTHRTGCSFDVQSFRVTEQKIIDVAKGIRSVEETFYVRPVGTYIAPEGGTYQYTEQQRCDDLALCQMLSRHYRQRRIEGVSKEHARSVIPFDVRQHFVLSLNARSLMHILDMRFKADAQLEIRALGNLLFDEFARWMPEVAQWYQHTRLGKGNTAP